MAQEELKVMGRRNEENENIILPIQEIKNNKE